MALKTQALMVAIPSPPADAACALAEPIVETEAQPQSVSRFFERSLIWLRRDLRLDDNRALFEAATRSRHVDLAFVFDDCILAGLARRDRRVEFMWQSLMQLKARLEAMGGTLFMLRGNPEEEIPYLARQLQVQAVFCGRDCEPAAQERDSRVAKELDGAGVALECVWDHLALPPDFLAAASGGFHGAFGPFKRAWDKAISTCPNQTHPQPTEIALEALSKRTPTRAFTLEELGFEPTDLDSAMFPPGEDGAQTALQAFLNKATHHDDANNDDLGFLGGSRLGPHLRFGTISPRHLLRAVRENASPDSKNWIGELAWRDFCAHLLWHRQDLAHGWPLNDKARDDARLEDSASLSKWQEGLTGFPFVDAAMRELRQTGFMHHQARKAAASFLCKNLLLDWRLGEAWFAAWLLDFDLASNNVDWQLCAGTGAGPDSFSRIFDPALQGRKLDAEGRYVARWVPELAQLPARWIHCPSQAPAEELARAGVELGRDYPWPMLDFKLSRARALAWSRGGDALAFSVDFSIGEARASKSGGKRGKQAG